MLCKHYANVEQTENIDALMKTVLWENCSWNISITENDTFKVSIWDLIKKKKHEC